MTTTPDVPRDESLSDEVLVERNDTYEVPTSDTPAGSSAPDPTQAPGSTATVPATPSPTERATSTATEPAASSATVATTPAAPEATPPAPAEPVYLRGPAPFAIVLGILGLVVAGVTLAAELTDVTIPWDNLGPWTVVAAGLLVLLVGAIGLRASRPQD